jgi:formamidopyrimidine-DNA glycosylase
VPELPDVQLYVEHLTRRLAGRVLERVRVASPFVLRTVSPPLAAAEGKTIRAFRRLGKRIVFELDGGPFLVVHLMVAGRFHWKDAGRAPVPGKVGLAAFDAASATLLLTEASPKKRASLHVVASEADLAALSRGGVEPLGADLAAFTVALRSENHTVKRALTDPRLFSGIGNAYSDEILHAARMSPFALTRRLGDDDVARLRDATRETLTSWLARLRAEAGDRFPEKVTAFRQDFAVHGRYGKPCPACGDPVQRLVYADNEANYCATCQTGGRLLADRALSRLLKDDWPRTLEELEEGRAARRER